LKTERDQRTPIERAAPQTNEFEVWSDQESVPPKLLLVLSVEGQKPLKIIDPAAGNAEIFASNHYLDIVAHLRHQEYVPVRGRMPLLPFDDDDDD
jgi:hypothetical protein